MSTKEEHDSLLIAGWKIHSKDGNRRYWVSPHDGKVYGTTFALIAERVAQEEKAERTRLERVAELEKGAAEYAEFDMYKEGALEEIVPPLEEKKSKKKTKKADRGSVDSNIRELGF